MKKEIAALVAELVEQGFEVRKTSAGHRIVFKDGRFVATLPGTPRGQRWYPNTIAALRRGGFVWPKQ